MNPILQKAFGFDPQRHKVRTEIMAGVTTFLTMAYILAVNPSIFSVIPGMPSGAVFTATALASIAGTLILAFYAKRPFALAPGMGLNAFFVYTVCLSMGYSWQFALTAVLIEGIIFVILSVTNVRTLILNSIPISLKNAIGAGIGLFIAFIGLQNAGIVVNSDQTLVTLGAITEGKALLSIIGLVVTGTLVMLHVPGCILIGILSATVMGLFIKDPATGEALTGFSGSVVSMPESVSPIFCAFDWSQVLSWDMFSIVLTFLFIGLFGTMGTVIAVSQKAGFADENGNVEGVEKVFMADAVGTVCAACLGTSTTSMYVESSAGVGSGGRTGLTAFSTAVCFALAMLFSNVFLAIPGAATAPVLIIIGMMMMQPVTKIDWTDYRESIPAFLTFILMPFAYSIADGIMMGFISYVILYALSGKYRKISPTMWILAAIFVLQYIFI